jgi:hypothetical protein
MIYLAVFTFWTSSLYVVEGAAPSAIFCDRERERKRRRRCGTRTSVAWRSPHWHRHHPSFPPRGFSVPPRTDPSHLWPSLHRIPILVSTDLLFTTGQVGSSGIVCGTGFDVAELESILRTYLRSESLQTHHPPPWPRVSSESAAAAAVRHPPASGTMP